MLEQWQDGLHSAMLCLRLSFSCDRIASFSTVEGHQFPVDGESIHQQDSLGKLLMERMSNYQHLNCESLTWRRKRHGIVLSPKSTGSSKGWNAASCRQSSTWSKALKGWTER